MFGLSVPGFSPHGLLRCPQEGWERHQSLAPVLIRGAWALLTCRSRGAGPSGGTDRLCLVKLPTQWYEPVRVAHLLGGRPASCGACWRQLGRPAVTGSASNMPALQKAGWCSHCRDKSAGLASRSADPRGGWGGSLHLPAAPRGLQVCCRTSLQWLASQVRPALQVYPSVSSAPHLWMDFAASRFVPYAVTAGATDMVLPFVAQV